MYNNFAKENVVEFSMFDFSFIYCSNCMIDAYCVYTKKMMSFNICIFQIMVPEIWRPEKAGGLPLNYNVTMISVI